MLLRTQKSAQYKVLSASQNSLRMPHKRNTWTAGKSHVGYYIPATVRVPVHIAGIDTAITVYSFNHSHVAVTTCTLHAGLQHDNRWHLGRARNNPAGRCCSIGPLVGIPKPGNPIPGQLMVAHISPVRTLAKGKTVEAASPCWRG